MLLRRYIGQTITGTSLVVVAALLGVELFIVFVGELGDIGNGDYGLGYAMQYALLTLPRQLYALFPMAGLLGVLSGLSILASHHELMVMRASGISIGQITHAVLKAALLMIVVVTILGETLAPFSQHKADQRKGLAISKGQALKTQQGTWIRENNSFFHIQTIVNSYQLQGVSRYQFDDANHLVLASYADQASYKDNQWVLRTVAQSHITDKHVQSEQLPQATWNLALPPHFLRMAMSEPIDMTLFQLYETMRYQQENGLQARRYGLAFWKRVLQPFATLVMMLLAIPFIFGPLRSAALGSRLVVGVCVGFGFYIFNEFLGSLSLVLQFSPLMAAALPLMVFAIGGWFLVRRL